MKAPKQVELWPELPRSRVGKVLKADVRTQLLDSHTIPLNLPEEGTRGPSWFRHGR